jgi:hypothetical protein
MKTVTFVAERMTPVVTMSRTYNAIRTPNTTLVQAGGNICSAVQTPIPPIVALVVLARCCFMLEGWDTTIFPRKRTLDATR